MMGLVIIIVLLCLQLHFNVSFASIYMFLFILQFTEEKLGTSEKTELDGQLETLQKRCDTTKLWTEKLVRDVDQVLTPNPGDFTY